MRATSLLAVPCVLAGLLFLSDARGAFNRTVVGGKFAVQVGGVTVTNLKEVSGGGPSTTVIVDRGGSAGQYPKKRVGPPTSEDIVLTTAGLPDKTLHDWVRASLKEAQLVKRDGAIVLLDFDYKEGSRLTWTRGAISEVAFPMLDAASKDMWSLDVTVTPESTAYSNAGAGKVDPANMPVVGAKSKAILASNFRFTIPGLSLTRVSRIEEIDVRFRAPPAAAPHSELRSFERTPGTVDVSNLVFFLPEADAAQIFAWYQSFVVKAAGADKEKKTATIEMLSADLKTVLSRITLGGVGIVKVTPAAITAGSEAVRKIRTEAFVESIQFEVTP